MDIGVCDIRHSGYMTHILLPPLIIQSLQPNQERYQPIVLFHQQTHTVEIHNSFNGIEEKRTEERREYHSKAWITTKGEALSLHMLKCSRGITCGNNSF